MKTLCLFALLKLAPVALLAQDLQVRASLDRDVVEIGDRFILTVELSGTDLNGTETPTPLPLDDFAAFLGNSSSQQIQMSGGRTSIQKMIGFIYRATREGTFRIPAIEVRRRGDSFQTQPLTIRVTRPGTGARAGGGSGAPNRTARDRASSQPEVFLEVSQNRERVYQNQALILTYDLNTAVNISTYAFASNPDTSGFWVEELLEDPGRPPTRNRQFRGRTYTVATVRHQALFPTVTGKRTLDPLVLEYEARLRSRRRGLFSNFFDDTFGQTVTRSVRSRPVEITVLPLPEKGRTEDFQGAVGTFAFQWNLDQKELSVNDVVNLRVEIQGKGNLHQIQAPKVLAPPGLEIYDPESTTSIRRTRHGLEGSLRFDYLIVPRQKGRLTIQPISFAYFDPDRETYAIESTGPIQLDVSGPDRQPGNASESSRQDIRLLNQDIRFIKLSSDSFRPLQLTLTGNPIFWICLATPILLVSAAVMHRRRTEELESNQAVARSRRAKSEARRRLLRADQLLKAGASADFYAEAGKALVQFIADKTDISAAGATTDQIRALLEERGVPPELVVRTLQCIESSDRMRFAPMAGDSEDMRSFREQLVSLIGMLGKSLRGNP